MTPFTTVRMYRRKKHNHEQQTILMAEASGIQASQQCVCRYYVSRKRAGFHPSVRIPFAREPLRTGEKIELMKDACQPIGFIEEIRGKVG